MKTSFKTLLVISVALLALISLTGCKIPYTTTSPGDPPAGGSTQESVKTTTPESSARGSTKPTISENTEQGSVSTAPSFSLTDINTGKSVQFPSDMMGSKTALVFFSLT